MKGFDHMSVFMAGATWRQRQGGLQRQIGLQRRTRRREEWFAQSVWRQGRRVECCVKCWSNGLFPNLPHSHLDQTFFRWPPLPSCPETPKTLLPPSPAGPHTHHQRIIVVPGSDDASQEVVTEAPDNLHGHTIEWWCGQSACARGQGKGARTRERHSPTFSTPLPPPTAQAAHTNPHFPTPWRGCWQRAGRPPSHRPTDAALCAAPHPRPSSSCATPPRPAQHTRIGDMHTCRHTHTHTHTHMHTCSLSLSLSFWYQIWS